LEHLLEMAARPNITLQVVRYEAGLHGLRSTDLMFLRTHDGQTTAYVETDHRGELISEAGAVEVLQQRYDAVRDLALSPAESVKFLGRLLEEESCDPPT
jgi:hypothetical protein